VKNCKFEIVNCKLIFEFCYFPPKAVFVSYFDIRISDLLTGWPEKK